jgi:hypothetical protein
MDDLWVLRAACASEDPKWWDCRPVVTDENKAAIRICLGCPVRQDCYDDAVRHRDEGVIRGGHRFGGLNARKTICPKCMGSFDQGWGRRYCSDECKQAAALERRRAELRASEALK